ncbi:TonB-dependent siderophore receptor [Bordetella genomosp. 12]|uniref:TonB-dependent siderophore receptor n=2 Tax=Bordetella genomosp. 12 TaxID=463035 RepID=A0A261VDN2_9BORD|nr:TonB-dependent siderophore receptor [Bordetella genomosp. 12]
MRISLSALAISIAVMCGTLPAPVQAQAASVPFSIPAQPLSKALLQLGEQASLQIFFPQDIVDGYTAPAVTGSLPPEEALRRLLAGTGIEFRRTGNNISLSRPGAGVELAPIAVHGALGATTEGTGSYTTNGPSTTATKLGLSLRETPQTVSVITRQRIEDQSLTSIADVLEQTPGISVQNIGSDRYTVYSRGYAIDNYQLDGLSTLSDIVSQNIPQGLADMAIYDRIEVLRGASGLLTGAGDPSGVINMVRKRPTREFQGHADVGYGSWDQYRAEVDVSGPLTEDGRVRGRLVGAHEQGHSYIDYYKTKKDIVYGVLEADVTDTTLLRLGVDYQRNDPRGASGSGFPLFYSDGEQTDLPVSTNAAARWNTNKIETTNTFMALEQKLPQDWSLNVAANYMDAKRHGKSADASWGYPDKTTGEGVLFYGGVSTGKQRQTSFDTHVKGPFQLLGREHELVLGFNFSEYKNFHEPLRYDGIEGTPVNIYTWGNDAAGPDMSSDEKLFDYDLHVKQYGGYSALRLKPRDDLAVILGARLSSYRYKLSTLYADPKLSRWNSIKTMRESDVITPYAGVIYDINEAHSVYASYTSIYKPQSYRNAAGDFLDPRDGDNYELGLKSEFLGGKLNSAVALFQIRQNNLAVADDGKVVAGTDREAAYRAVKGAKTEGLDMELNGELMRNWNIAVSYTYSQTKDAQGERITTLVPRHMAKLWTTYRLPGDWHRVTLGGGVNWQSKVYLTVTPWDLGKTVTAKQDSYAVVNLMGRYDFSKQLSATLNVYNLFDKKYLSSLDENFYTGYYGASRSVMLNMRYSF